MRYFILLLILLLGCRIAEGRALAPTEKNIQQYVMANQASALDLLEKIVNINSGTANVPGVVKVGELLRSEFNALGFKTYWVEAPASMKRAGTLFAVHKGNRGKKIILIGHLDTVFPPNVPFQQFTQHKKIAYGPGVIDDKGGDIVILYALKALQSAHALDDATIVVALTGDEEDSGKPTTISRKPLVDAARQMDVALDFECSLGLDTATISRRGVSQFVIQTYGASTHSAQMFQKGSSYGAIFELARILNSVRVEFSQKKYLATNPGIILGGTVVNYDKNTSQGTALGKKNIIARTATVHNDLRFVSAAQQQWAKKKIKQIISRPLPGTRATVQFTDGIPAMPPTQNNLKLLRLYSQASIDLGHKKVLPLGVDARGAGDISFVASVVPANLGGLGPLSAGDGAHSMHEGMNIRSLTIATERAALLIYRLIQ